MSNTPKTTEAGVIVGEASSNEFFFASKAEEYPPKWEYLVVSSKESVGGIDKDVQVVAQVDKIISASKALTEDTDFDALRRIIDAKIHDVRTYGKARILGYLEEGQNARVLQPRRAVTPGKLVHIAPKDLLGKFYSYPAEEGLHLGHLITRSDVPALLSVKGFRRHLAIIAQTGAGKSYCAGVTIEELLRKGATVIVIDPHSDYVLLSMTQQGGRHELSECITVFRNPASTGRYKLDAGNVKPYELAFKDLDFEEVCEIAGIPSNASKQREAVRKAILKLREKETDYTPEELLKMMENPEDWVKGEEDEEKKTKSDVDEATALATSKYIRNLTTLKVFGTSSTPIQDLLKPKHASIIDLSGLEDKAMDYIASRILTQTYDEVTAERFGYPVFVFIEEAHKFIPPEKDTYSASIVNKISAEGRKFGVFLTLITQRPSKVHSDSLSQANSQIIMKLTNPKDQEAVAKSSEKLSADLLNDLPGLNPGECVIVGEVTKAPVMLRVRERTTKEGGADIDVISKLNEALTKATDEKEAEKDQTKRGNFSGSFLEGADVEK